MAAMKPKREAPRRMPPPMGSMRTKAAPRGADRRTLEKDSSFPEKEMMMSSGPTISKGGAKKKASVGGFLSSFLGSSSSSKADAAPELMMAKASAAPMMAESMGAMAMEEGCAAPENFEMKQQMAFQSTAIGDLTGQVRRKQAAVRSKKSMF